MNIYDKFLEWEKNDDSELLFCLFTTYNPEKRKEHLKTYFDLENGFKDKKYFAHEIIDSLKYYEIEYFTAQINDPVFSWVPSYISKDEKKILRKKLNLFNWGTKKYYGKIIVNNMNAFFEEYLDYPLRYSYQDIVLVSDKSDLLIVFSYHGTIWFLSEDEKRLSKVKLHLEKSGVTVKESNNMKH
jgi:hypothetical protein